MKWKWLALAALLCASTAQAQNTTTGLYLNAINDTMTAACNITATTQGAGYQFTAESTTVYYFGTIARSTLLFRVIPVAPADSTGPAKVRLAVQLRIHSAKITSIAAGFVANGADSGTVYVPMPIAQVSSLTSASVSYLNELTATTTGTPNRLAFSMCLARLPAPFSSSGRFSSV